MADLEDYGPAGSGANSSKKRAGSDAGSEDVVPEYCTRSVLPFLPAPFGNLWILVLLCAALAGVAYPIAQAWSKTVTYRSAPGVRSQLVTTRKFPNFTAAFCPQSDALAANLVVYSDYFQQAQAMRKPLPAPPAAPQAQLDQGDATYFLPTTSAGACEAQINGQAKANGPLTYDNTQSSVPAAECGVSFPTLPSALNVTSGRYNKQRIIKVMTLRITACGGPLVQVLDASGDVVATTAGGVMWDNPAIFQPCDPNSPTPAAKTASITVELSTPYVDLYGITQTGDYEWLDGYTIKLSCIPGNDCIVNGPYSTVRMEAFQLPTVAQSIADFPNVNPGVRVMRPTRNVSLLGDTLHSPSCWLVTAAAVFGSAERTLPLMDTSSPTPFQVMALSDGMSLMYGFFDANDPDGLANLFATSSMAFVPMQTNQVSLVRLGATVSHKLRPYSPDLGQVFGIEVDEGTPPDPWPPTSDDLTTFEVSLNITSAAEVIQSSPQKPFCAKDAGYVDRQAPLITDSRSGCPTYYAIAGFIFHPALVSYQVTVLEEYYPFDDSDAVQTMFTYLPFLPDYILPALVALPVLLTKLARRVPALSGALGACR
jgi:hypothetical protein